MAVTKKHPRKLVVPSFRTEREEALWWDRHMPRVEKDLLEALKNPAAPRGTAMKLSQAARPTRNITIRLAVEDIDRARLLANRKGIGYQTYVKMLLHEALEREARESS